MSIKHKIRKIKDEPIGKLIRPIKLYKGYIYPTNIKENFSSWFSQTKKSECLFQTQKDSVMIYKLYTDNLNKNIIEQYKTFNFGNLKQSNNGIVDGYCGVVTGFIYYFNKEYHVCRSEKEQAAMIKKSKKNSNIQVSFLLVKFYRKIDMENKKGLDEWEFHSSESFELIYPVDDIILLEYLLNVENIEPGYSIKSSKGEHIVLETARFENSINIITNSLSDIKITILTKNRIKNLDPSVFYLICKSISLYSL